MDCYQVFVCTGGSGLSDLARFLMNNPHLVQQSQYETETYGPFQRPTEQPPSDSYGDAMKAEQLRLKDYKGVDRIFEPPTSGRAVGLDVGGLTMRPNISLEGGTNANQSESDVENSGFEVGGRLGLDFNTKLGYGFGGGASGGYWRGSSEFPQHMQDQGAPDKVTYGTRGVDVNNYDAYLNTPSGINLRGSYSPTTNDKMLRLGYRYRF